MFDRMITYSVSTGIRAPLSREALTNLAQTVARSVPIINQGVEVAFVSANEIKRLNHSYRGKNRPTDVLSFSFVHEIRAGEPPGFRMIGQMYLAPSVIKEQAARFKTPFRVEFARMFVHGLLHCSGLDHQKTDEARAMFALQERILRSVGPKIGLPSTRIPARLHDDYFKQAFVFPES